MSGAGPNSRALGVHVAGLLLTWAAAGEAAHSTLLIWVLRPISLALLGASSTTVAVAVHAAITGVLAAPAGEPGGGVCR